MTSVTSAAPLRAGRGAVFTATALGLGVGAHLAGGGRLPGFAALVFLAIPVAWIAFFLTRAWRGWPVVITSLLAIEAGLHEGLTVLSGPAAHLVPGPMAGHGQMAMGAHAMMLSPTATALPDGMGAMPLASSLAMLAAHLVATVLTGAALAYGEHLVWRLWTWLHHAVTVSAELVQPSTPQTVALAWPLTVNPVGVPADRRVRRRGPPRPRTGLPASA